MLVEKENPAPQPHWEPYSKSPLIDPALWAELKSRVIDEQRRGKTLESFAATPFKFDVNDLKQWLTDPAGLPIYGGRDIHPKHKLITDSLVQYFAAIDAKGVTHKAYCPASVETSVTAAIAQGIASARAMCVPRLIDAPPGVGKTEGINQYLSKVLKSEGHQCPVWKIRLDGLSLTNKSVLALILRQVLGADGRDDRSEFTVAELIDRATEGRGGVLLIDEAQHLGDASTKNATAIINVLRRFTDTGHFGIVMFGNGEIYRHLSKGGRHTQILSRMDAFRVEIAGLDKGKPGQVALLEEDVFAVLQAWGVKGADVEQWCLRLAQLPGALRNVTNAFRVAMDEFETINIAALKRVSKL